MALTYSLISGTLPPGLSVDPNTGLLRGVTLLDNPPIWVTNAGTISDVSELSNISIQLAATANGTGGTISYAMVPQDDNPNPCLPFGVTMTSNGLISGTVGEVADDYSLPFSDNQLPLWTTNAGTLATINEQTTISNISLTANARSGNSATIARYSVTSGALPFGLMMTSNGVIYGTAPEDYDGEVPVNPNRPTWNTLAGTLGFLGENTSGTYTLSANAVANASISRYFVTSGILPLGMLLTASTGVISGTVGEVTDSSEPLYINTSLPTWVTNATLGSLDENASATYTLVANATAANTTIARYFIISGAMPFGLLLTASTGLISGTVGEITDPNEPPAVLSNGPTWNTASGSLGSVANNASFSATLSATAYTGRTLRGYVINSGLPFGLVLTTSTGTISGTVKSDAGIFTFNAAAVDTTGALTSRTFSITVT